MTKIILRDLFPTIIWSEISFFIPKEFFQLCEKLHLPYHYASSIKIDFKSDCTYTNYFLRYPKLSDLRSNSRSSLLRLPSKLHVCVLTNYIESLEPLNQCQFLHIVDMPSFMGSLKPLSACPNLREVRMFRFNGDLDPLRKLKNLQKLEMDNFVGNWERSLEPLKELEHLETIKMNGFIGNLEPLKGLPELQIIQMRSFIRNPEPLLACPKLKKIVLHKFEGDFETLKKFSDEVSFTISC